MLHVKYCAVAITHKEALVEKEEFDQSVSLSSKRWYAYRTLYHRNNIYNQRNFPLHIFSRVISIPSSGLERKQNGSHDSTDKTASLDMAGCTSELRWWGREGSVARGLGQRTGRRNRWHNDTRCGPGVDLQTRLGGVRRR